MLNADYKKALEISNNFSYKALVINCALVTSMHHLFFESDTNLETYLLALDIKKLEQRTEDAIKELLSE